MILKSICFIVFVSSVAAAESGYIVDRKIDESVLVDFDKSVEAANKELQRLTAERADLEKNMSKVQGDISNSGCMSAAVWDVGRCQGDKALQSFQAAQTKFDDLKNQQRALEPKIQKATTAYTKVAEVTAIKRKQFEEQKAKEQDPVERDKQFALAYAADERLQKINFLELTFVKEKVAGMEIGNQLNSIEHRIDNMMIGAYFQDKMGALLNSRVFCDAVNKKCGDVEKFIVPEESIRRELFPTTSSGSQRSGADQRARTWDEEVKRRKGTK